MGSNAANRRTWKGNYEWIITVLKANPKRPGSDAHKRFSLYRSGMTPNAYVLACKDAPGADIAKIDLAWDSAHGFIKIEPPTK